MTVTYNSDVNTAGFMTFIQLFFRWKGSLWKAVYKELILWLFFYAVLALTYKILLTEPQKRVFEGIAVFFAKYTDFIPLTFMLGFFVNLVVQRWMNMGYNLGFIDVTAMNVCSYIQGDDERAKILRRTILRYLLFLQALAYRTMSEVILCRFPTLDSFVAAGYISAEELKMLNDIELNYSPVSQLWIPMKWAFDTVRIAREENRITDHGVQDLYKKFGDFRGNLGMLLTYDWIPIPLLYTQVVCLTVRLYFIICLMGRQNLEQAPRDDYIDPINLYIPVMTIFQFIFYMGWMKVAEALLNPLGDDDDDFEVNFLLDRNLQVAMAMANSTHRPPLIRDVFWDQPIATPMYSLQTIDAVVNPMVGSALLHAQQEGYLRSRECRTSIMVPRDNTTVIDDDEKRSSIASFHSGIVDAVRRKISLMKGSVYPEHDEYGMRKRKTSHMSSKSTLNQDISQNSTLHKPHSEHRESLFDATKFFSELGSKPKPHSQRKISELPAVVEEEERNGSVKSMQAQPVTSKPSIYSVESCSIVFSEPGRATYTQTQPLFQPLHTPQGPPPEKPDESKEHIL